MNHRDFYYLIFEIKKNGRLSDFSVKIHILDKIEDVSLK